MDEKNIITMISFAGAAKSKVISAIRKAAEKNYEEAEMMLNEAEEDLANAHKAQTEFLFKDCNDKTQNLTKTEVSVLLVHAMDQVMDAMLMRDLAAEIINLVRKA